MKHTHSKLILLLLSVVIVTACSTTPTPMLIPSLSLAEMPFTNVDLGYSVRYPQGWVIEEGEEPEVVIFLDNRVKPTAGTLPAMPVTVTVLSGTRAALGVPQGEITSTVVLTPLLRKMGVGMKIEAKAPVAALVAGKPAARAQVEGTLNVGTELAGQVVVVDVGERVWGAFALAPVGEWAAFALVFEQMVGSVRFSK